MKSKPEKKAILLHLSLIVVLLSALTFFFVFQICLDAQETTKRGNRKRQGARTETSVTSPVSSRKTPQAQKPSAVDSIISLEIDTTSDSRVSLEVSAARPSAFWAEIATMSSPGSACLKISAFWTACGRSSLLRTTSWGLVPRDGL